MVGVFLPGFPRSLVVGPMVGRGGLTRDLEQKGTNGTKVGLELGITGAVLAVSGGWLCDD